MTPKEYSWKAEWLAVGENPGPVTEEERQQAKALSRENEEFLKKNPPEHHVAVIQKKWGQQKRSKMVRWNLWVLPLAAAAVFAVLFTLPQEDGISTFEHLKGAAHTKLFLYREKLNGKAENLAPETLVKAGDRLQASYLTTRSLQGAILSVDGDRNITVHLASEGHSVPLISGKEQPLAFSYELDRAPRYEVFFLFTSENAFDIERLKTVLVSKPWTQLEKNDFGTQIQWLMLPLKKDASE